jgi:hypothetical protein
VVLPIVIHLPGDPNGITGPAGYSSPGPQWVSGKATLPYVVNFQNESTATAPAVQVVVTEAVPPDIDPNSVQLTGFGFGASTSVSIPASEQSFSQQFTNLNLPNGDYLDVSGVYDPQAGANGVITWTFSTIDPTTGDLDGSPNAGFLPPDDAAGDGEGFVSWAGTAKSGLTTGTTITGQASIVFDRNAAIPTAVWTNTVDATPPTASMTQLPATSPAGNLDVSWSGQDGTGSGVATYDLYESTDGGPLTLILPSTTLTSTQVPIVSGHTYGFAVDATDNVGNQGAVPTAVQTTTSAGAASSSDTVTFNSEGGSDGRVTEWSQRIDHHVADCPDLRRAHLYRLVPRRHRRHRPHLALHLELVAHALRPVDGQRHRHRHLQLRRRQRGRVTEWSQRIDHHVADCPDLRRAHLYRLVPRRHRRHRPHLALHLELVAHALRPVDGQRHRHRHLQLRRRQRRSPVTEWSHRHRPINVADCPDLRRSHLYRLVPRRHRRHRPHLALHLDRSSLTLYAQWTTNATVTVTFNSEGGSASPVTEWSHRHDRSRCRRPRPTPVTPLPVGSSPPPAAPPSPRPTP